MLFGEVGVESRSRSLDQMPTFQVPQPLLRGFMFVGFFRTGGRAPECTHVLRRATFGESISSPASPTLLDLHPQIPDAWLKNAGYHAARADDPSREEKTENETGWHRRLQVHHSPRQPQFPSPWMGR